MKPPATFPTLPYTPPLFAAAYEYWTDAWQRSILFWDVLRERGNHYIEHEQDGKPPVLVFDYHIVVDARRLPRPANYALASIVPPEGCPPADPKKRPFIVIDPRAGHGPGIGGFKMDSEIGIALKQGHPCYFFMFFPQPVPGQTIECVTAAEQVFLDKVNELHPDTAGKPFVIGNCQGGWALMMLAALSPQKVGPILLAGSPISYWAGVAGKNPMRYSGGLLGGTWTASLLGDLGNGKFDGAHLVNNFEQLDPANTYWHKLHHLYANIDTERERFLEFERWWGGHFLLNKQEMEWITQNLFVGNRLSSGAITLDDGRARVDLRKIRSPIVVFASWGDNITPPQQALNWIPDLYDSVEEIRDNEQTIVYFLHEKIGHLGIFVSSGVANREHSEFASALDLIDVLPPGLYEAVIKDTYPDMPGLEYADGRYVIRFEPRDVSDILALDDGREDERAFELVRRVSQVNQSIYNAFISPWVRMCSNELTATIWNHLNPARFERRLLSDSNPALKMLQPIAEKVREQRKPVSTDNAWLQAEGKVSDIIERAWDSYRDNRDAAYESLFKLVYESPWLSIMFGMASWDERAAKARSHTWERDEMLRLKREAHEAWFEHGSPEGGFLRLLIYVAIGSGVVDERPFNGIKRVMRDIGLDKTVTVTRLKESIKKQTFLVRMEEERALQGLPALLPDHHQRVQALNLARELLALGGPISEEKEERLRRVAEVLGLQPYPVSAPAPEPVDPPVVVVPPSAQPPVEAVQQQADTPLDAATAPSASEPIDPPVDAPPAAQPPVESAQQQAAAPLDGVAAPAARKRKPSTAGARTTSRSSSKKPAAE